MEELKKKIENIEADSTKSVNQKIEEIQGIVLSFDEYSSNAFEISLPAYEAIRRILLKENYEDCYVLDLLMCNVLLAEAYNRNQRHWLIAPLAEQCHEMMLGITTDDEEALKTMISVIDRMCSELKGTGHSRLMMRLYALQFNFEKQRPEPDNEALTDTATQMITLATLTGCDTWYAPIQEEVVALMGEAAIKEIVDNPYTGHLKVDEVVYTEEYEKVVDEVDAEVNKLMGDKPYGMGMCFEIWSLKKKILKANYGIEWRSPREMNPRVMFD